MQHGRSLLHAAAPRVAATLLLLVAACTGQTPAASAQVQTPPPGQVWAWGWSDNVWGAVAGPAQVAGIAPARALAAGGGHSLAVGVDGSVWAWGSDSFDQLGFDPPVHTLVGSIYTAPQRVTGIGPATAVAAGSISSMALEADGTVWTWGTGYSGELGNAAVDPATCLVTESLVCPAATPAGPYLQPPTTSARPVQVCEVALVPVLAAAGAPSCAQPLTGVTAIAAGWEHMLALTNDGTVWSWGYNFRGQLGDGTTVARGSAGRVVFPTGTRVTAIAAGGEHSLALGSDGSVWTWGNNESDLQPPCAPSVYVMPPNLATGCTLPQRMPGLPGIGCPPRPAVDAAGRPCRPLAAGYDFSLALDPDGRVWSWGTNPAGTGFDSSPVQVGGVPAAVSLAAGGVRDSVYLDGISGRYGSRSTALTAAGDVWEWGQDNTVSPARVSLPAAASTIADGFSRSLAAAPPPLRSSLFSGEASIVEFSGASLAGGIPVSPLEGGLGLCQAGPVATESASKVTGSGLPGCEVDVGIPPSGGTPLLTAHASTETVTTGNGAAHANSKVASLSLLPGMGLGGADVLDAGGLDAQASASCSGTGHGTPSSSSSIGSLNINGTRVATQPVGSRIIFNPTGRNPITLYGNPITVNPTGARVPMAIVTLNYSRYDPATNSQVSSPLEVEFPPGGALASVIVGRVFVSYATGACN